MIATIAIISPDQVAEVLIPDGVAPGAAELAASAPAKQGT